MIPDGFDAVLFRAPWPVTALWPVSRPSHPPRTAGLQLVSEPSQWKGDLRSTPCAGSGDPRTACPVSCAPAGCYCAPPGCYCAPAGCYCCYCPRPVATAPRPVATAPRPVATALWPVSRPSHPPWIAGLQLFPAIVRERRPSVSLMCGVGRPAHSMTLRTESPCPVFLSRSSESRCKRD